MNETRTYNTMGQWTNIASAAVSGSTYDALNRLAWGQAYAYDGFGNLQEGQPEEPRSEVTVGGNFVAIPERQDSLAILFARVHGRYAQAVNIRKGRSAMEERFQRNDSERQTAKTA